MKFKVEVLQWVNGNYCLHIKTVYGSNEEEVRQKEEKLLGLHDIIKIFPIEEEPSKPTNYNFGCDMMGYDYLKQK